jgi:hypothetical protein
MLPPGRSLLLFYFNFCFIPALAVSHLQIRFE